jgi:hypothetical protein
MELKHQNLNPMLVSAKFLDIIRVHPELKFRYVLHNSY